MIQTSTGLEDAQLTPRHASVFRRIPPATRMWPSANVVYSPCSHLPNSQQQEENATGPMLAICKLPCLVRLVHAPFSSQELGVTPTSTPVIRSSV